jgi:methionyl-tRNA synthetase
VDAFSTVAYVEKLDTFVAEVARFRAFEQAKRKISMAQEEVRTSAALEYLALKAFATLVYPVMPVLGTGLWQGLGLAGPPRRERNWSFIPGGTRTELGGRTVLGLVRGDTAEPEREAP